MADPTAWAMVDTAQPQPQPQPARRAVRGYAEVANGLAAAAYGPDRS